MTLHGGGGGESKDDRGRVRGRGQSEKERIPPSLFPTSLPVLPRHSPDTMLQRAHARPVARTRHALTCVRLSEGDLGMLSALLAAPLAGACLSLSLSLSLPPSLSPSSPLSLPLSLSSPNFVLQCSAKAEGRHVAAVVPVVVLGQHRARSIHRAPIPDMERKARKARQPRRRRRQGSAAGTGEGTGREGGSERACAQESEREPRKATGSLE